MITRLLVANRGDIAIRIMRTAASLGITSVAVYSADDKDALHAWRADQSIELAGEGAAAYLDMEAIINAAKQGNCDAIHPGYGFLSENAGFARQCDASGITFVGPDADTLALFGDKGAARRLAAAQKIPIAAGTSKATSLDEARQFLAALPAGDRMIIKAIAGGGGRGVHIVDDPATLDDAFARCAREAEAAFGSGELYVEQFIPDARHIEVQILADHAGNTRHLGERDCSLQRRHQKVMEIAPAPGLDAGLAGQIHVAAVQLTASAGHKNAGTIEFLVDPAHRRFVFIEANARLQVEHTVTEQVTGIDLVEAQLRIATGEPLAAVLADAHAASGTAIQLRINMETMQANGAAKPSSGTIGIFNPPSAARHSPRYLRLSRLCHQSTIRLSPRQTDRASASRRLRKCPRERLPRALRIPDRRRRNQHRLSAESAI